MLHANVHVATLHLEKAAGFRFSYFALLSVTCV
jgi:hypothetical protein